MNNDYFYSAYPFDQGLYTLPTATYPYLVFADAIGFKPPSFKHPTRKAAEAEARRLADLNPGVNYYVLGSLSHTRAQKAPKATTRSLV